MRQHVGAIGEEGDPPEAFRLALRAQHSARGIEAHQLGIGGRVDLDFGLDRRAVALDLDHELRPVHPPLAVGLDRDELQGVAVEPERPVVLAVALDIERRPNPRPARVQIEVEADLGDQPVRRAIVFAANRDMGWGRRRFGRGLGVGEGGYVSHGDRDLGGNLRPSKVTGAAGGPSAAARHAPDAASDAFMQAKSKRRRSP